MAREDQTAMNKIVREYYPAEKLPDDLRDALGPGDVVKVTVETVPSAGLRRPWTFEELNAIAAKLAKNEDDPVGRIRALRDEWD
jgi:hypothetical protein